TVLHEVMHLALGINAAAQQDWIVEGLAEFYSLQLLQRSGTISKRRFENALAKQREWAAKADDLCRDASTGAVTARAVALFADLDGEIRQASELQASLDDVVRQLVAMQGPLDIEDLNTAVAATLGKKSELLDTKNLDGCHSMAS
ncbi:MAG: hypothetical protein KJO82_10495, partial [Gammaproteobacteria bacterium]|nr:hypothetical protein [Gammaproteobacteria bacterium]